MPSRLSEISALAEKMRRFAEAVKAASADNGDIAVPDELTQVSAEIERDFAALTSEERAELRARSEETVAALETYIASMRGTLNETQDSLNRLTDIGDACDAYKEAQEN